ncbi:hypothetical protein, partial [Mesorhizobium sp. WSM3873]|uniref:hypothetical protein n=1 Tax=Mesorhizobium sp. WSM3873 TaxID=1854056 RepID=UPI001AED0B09
KQKFSKIMPRVDVARIANCLQDRQNKPHSGLLCYEKASQESFFCGLAIANQLICDSPGGEGGRKAAG